MKIIIQILLTSICFIQQNHNTGILSKMYKHIFSYMMSEQNHKQSSCYLKLLVQYLNFEMGVQELPGLLSRNTNLKKKMNTAHSKKCLLCRLDTFYFFKRIYLFFGHTRQLAGSQFPVVVQSHSRVRLCDPMDCSTPSFPVHHLSELAQTPVH